MNQARAEGVPIAARKHTLIAQGQATVRKSGSTVSTGASLVVTATPRLMITTDHY